MGVQAVDDVVADIEAKLHERAEKEITSLELGELVMEHLQKLDQVAYVRFASVYRQFKDISQFMDEVKRTSSRKARSPSPPSRPRCRAPALTAPHPSLTSPSPKSPSLTSPLTDEEAWPVDLSRRDFIRSTCRRGRCRRRPLAGTAAEAAKGERPMQLAQAMTPAPSGFNPADPALKYDLVIAGARCLDPSQRLRGRMDIGIRFGQTPACAQHYPGSERAADRCRGGSDPGPGGSAYASRAAPGSRAARRRAGAPSPPPPPRCPPGDCGWHHLRRVQHLAVAQSRTRIFGFVHIASIGLAGGLAPGEMSEHRLCQRGWRRQGGGARTRTWSWE